MNDARHTILVWIFSANFFVLPIALYSPSTSILWIEYTNSIFKQKRLFGHQLAFFYGSLSGTHPLPEVYHIFRRFRLPRKGNAHAMKEYLDVLEAIYQHGDSRTDRTGTGTRSIFSPGEMRFLFEDGFPLVTTKRMAWKSIVWELLFFIRGETNNSWLTDRNVTIWNEWAKSDGSLGPIYGHQWRKWPSSAGSVDQLQWVIDEICTNPQSRRLVVSAWNPSDIPSMALPPCHMMFQFYCHGSNDLSMKVIQRSADMFLGIPFNIASYGLLLAIIAQITKRQPHSLVFSIGDAHIYADHMTQVEKQLSRTPLVRPALKMPAFSSLSQVGELTPDDFFLANLQYHPALLGKVSV